jgi:hypothetical protein
MPFVPQNDLERSLANAASDPAHRPAFYRAFVAADVFVIQHGAHLPKDGQPFAMRPGDVVELGRLELGGKSYIPVFTSLGALESFAAGATVNYLRLNARDFLTMTRGSALFLNPRSELYKELTAAEIAQILDGTLLQPD